MKLEYTILGWLELNPLTGYDLKKFLDTEGRFARKRAPLSQIYTTLKRMADKGWVQFREEPREGKPDAKIYHNTEAGRQVLVEYLRSPIELRFRYNESDISYRMAFSFMVEPEVTLQQIKSELAYRKEQIAQFRHRDRTLVSSNLSKHSLAFAQEVFDKLHQYGANNIDAYVQELEEMIEFFETKKAN